MVQTTSDRTGVLYKKIREIRWNWEVPWLKFVWLGLLPFKPSAVRITVRE